VLETLYRMLGELLQRDRDRALELRVVAARLLGWPVFHVDVG
jgi:hypothetical protein